jgi:MFS family permease
MIDLADASQSAAPVAGCWKDLVRPQYAFATITLCLGVGLFAFDAFFVSTALPSAVVDLDGTAMISWSLSLYLIFSIVSGSGASFLQKRFGARAMFAGAAVVFLAGTLIAATAGAMPALLLGRSLQGLSGGLIEAGCYAVIPEIFPPQLISKVFGAEAVVWAAAAFGGPLLAGYVTEWVSWRAAFLASLPLLLLFAALVPVVVPADKAAAQGAPFPILRLGAMAAGMLLVTWSSIADGNLPAAAMVAGAAAIFIAVIRLDGKTAARLFPRGAFAISSPIGLGFWIILLMPAAEASASVYLVFAIQHLWHYPLTCGGALNAIMALSWSLSQFTLSSLDRGGLRLHAIRLGPVMLVAGLLGLVAAFRFIDLSTLIVAQLLIGSAFGIVWGCLSQALMEIAPGEERYATSALLLTLYSAGYAIGAALMGLIGNLAGFASARADGDLQHALIVVFSCASALAIGALIASIRIVTLLRRAPSSPPK